MTGPITRLTGDRAWFEDFAAGQRMRHSRGATVGEVENAQLTKQVMNTAQVHWNEHHGSGGALAAGRVVFGLITASMVVGLASQDTASNALAEVRLDRMRFRAPVHHGDTLYALSEVLSAQASPEREDAGLVRFHHLGITQDNRLVFECERTVLVKRASHWRKR